MKRKLMFFMTFLFVGIGLVTAQTSRVTGVVTAEEDGLPVVGASVLVNGTTLGTITDIDGKFIITKLLQKREMRKDIVIELSYKGFSRASDYS